MVGYIFDITIIILWINHYNIVLHLYKFMARSPNLMRNYKHKSHNPLQSKCNIMRWDRLLQVERDITRYKIKSIQFY